VELVKKRQPQMERLSQANRFKIFLNNLLILTPFLDFFKINSGNDGIFLTW
jgi:hypothetical protein